jgi:RNA polymerase sigma factor (sigma-70 family)
MVSPYSTVAESVVWQDFKQGSKEAYEYIYRKYVTILYNYGYRITRDKSQTQDCIQDVFINLLTHREKLTDTDSIKFYLFKSLRRELMRKREIYQTLAYPDNNPNDYDFEVTFSYEHQLIESQLLAERSEHLLRVLNELPPRQKEAIFLRFYDNLSYEEIAAIMGIDQSSTYKLMYKAIDRMHQILVGEIILLLLLYYGR